MVPWLSSYINDGHLVIAAAAALKIYDRFYDNAIGNDLDWDLGCGSLWLRASSQDVPMPANWGTPRQKRGSIIRPVAARAQHLDSLLVRLCGCLGFTAIWLLVVAGS